VSRVITVECDRKNSRRRWCTDSRNFGPAISPQFHSISFVSRALYTVIKVKERIAVNGFPSHSYRTSLVNWISVTCYPTQVNAPRLNPSQ